MIFMSSVMMCTCQTNMIFITRRCSLFLFFFFLANVTKLNQSCKHSVFLNQGNTTIQILKKNSYADLSGMPSQKEETDTSEPLSHKPSRIPHPPHLISERSLTRWGKQAGFFLCFENPSMGLFELVCVQGRLIKPLQRHCRPHITSGLWWPLTRSFTRVETEKNVL